MLFTSPVFVLFFLAVLLLSRLPLNWGLRKGILLLASYVFYASWNPPFVLLLIGSTLVDYIVALRMGRSEKPRARKALLVVSVCVNLGVLAAFKYANFLSQSFADFSGLVGWEVSYTIWNIVLPLGISFYTFQTMSYTIDVYRGKLQPTRNLADFALYVTFFPQLVAGPIVRASDFLWQLNEPRRGTAPQIYWGVLLFILGLFKKAFLADAVFAPVADQVYAAGATPTALQAWVGTYAFAGQIYCDFSGYSDMAIACALMLGFRLPDNFRGPYGAIGFSDFWRRWHISLSSWLRDYLYIPLGGNRKGRIRTRLNLFVTMLLGGLWHGAAWTFVAWGALHGIYLGAERVARRYVPERVTRSRFVKAPLILLTFHLVCFGWILFRAETFLDAGSLISTMAGLQSAPGLELFSRWNMALVLAGVGGLIAVHSLWRERRIEDLSAKAGWLVTGAVAAVMLFLALTAGDRGAEFIYFQF
ncbi:MAG: MBOAT family protein [Planctomycetes bacterium]|nr:MBOAT family protein [Planctomycetota bacterium]MCB9935346.1 MBOAT family protein [Planctomycetota bacterium]